MRSFNSALAASIILGFTAATPVSQDGIPVPPWERDCPAPQKWSSCADGWYGCCIAEPCRGPMEEYESFCPDYEVPKRRTGFGTNPVSPANTGTPIQSGYPVESGVHSSIPPASSEDPTPTACAPTGPASSPGASATDDAWQSLTPCKADDSNCNWSPTYHIVNNGNTDYSTKSKIQFFAQKTESDENRYDAIAVFEIPDHVKRCEIGWYRPFGGVFYGTFQDGNLQINKFDMTGKTFIDAAGENVTWSSAQSLIAAGEKVTSLDLGNHGYRREPVPLASGTEFPCEGKELVLQFQRFGPQGAVIFDQISKGDGNFATRAGFFIEYDPKPQETNIATKA